MGRKAIGGASDPLGPDDRGGGELPVPDIPRLVSGATIGIVAAHAAIAKGSGNCFKSMLIVNRRQFERQEG